MKKYVLVGLFLVVAIAVWYFIPLFATSVMKALLVVLIVLAVTAVVLVPLIAAVVWFGFPWLAEENILFTTVKASTAKAIMRGKSFERFIMSFAGYHLNDPKKPGYKPLTVVETTDKEDKKVEKRDGFPDWDVVYHGKGNKNGFEEEKKDGDGKTVNEQDDEYHEHRNPILKHLGLYWVGWPWRNSVYVYQFQWNVTVTNKKTGNEEMLPRAEPADFVYVNDVTYAIKTVPGSSPGRRTEILVLVSGVGIEPTRAD